MAEITEPVRSNRKKRQSELNSVITVVFECQVLFVGLMYGLRIRIRGKKTDLEPKQIFFSHPSHNPEDHDKKKKQQLQPATL